MLELKPDMASLATGSVNFPTSIYENPPDFIEKLASDMLKYDVKPEIEIFDLSMLYKTGDLIKKGLIKSPAHVQFVFGLAMPPRSQISDFLFSELEEVLPDATWTAAGIGRQRFTVAQWCLERGGHCRTGREDNVRYDETRLAKSNAKLVEKITKVCERYDRRPATAQEAR